MKLRPLNDRVLIQRIEEEVTKGGIVIPENAKEKPSRGKIVAVGSGRRLKDERIVPLDVKIGDTVVFGKYSGTDIRIDDEEYVVMREEDIMGIFEL